MNEMRLRECFVRALGTPLEQVHDLLGPYAAPGWDSIGHMALVAELEAVFGVVLEVDDITSLINVGSARDLLLKRGIPFP